MVIFPLAPDQTIAQMWSNGAHLFIGCFQSTSTYSTLEVSHLMRYINSRIT